jgi:glucose dehydrogenase
MMRKILLVAVAAGVAAATILALASAATSVTIPAFTPADEMKAGTDWIMPQGNLQAQRHSSLTQITPANVGSLKLAFSFALDGTGYEPQPLFGTESGSVEYKGVLYAMDAVGRVYATDATNGNRLWYFEPNNANYPTSQAQKVTGQPALVTVAAVRGLTIGDGMVFAPEPQGVLIALDAKTGHQIWAHAVLNPAFQGTLAEPPVYYQNKIIMATAGGDGGFSCIVFAVDAKTGRSLWHFNIIPHKGQAGYETWSQPLFWNGGGASWAPIAVDPATNLLYVSTGNTIPYTGYERGPGKEYYTAGTLALNADTGKLAWFFQEVHHDNWDADTTLGPVLYDVTYNGKLLHAVAGVNRTGILFLLDRATGKPIYPIKETPVPVYDPVHSYATQPFPTGVLDGTMDPIFPKTLDDPNWTAFQGLQGPDGKPFIYHNDVPGQTYAQPTPAGYTIRVGSNISGQHPSSYDPQTQYHFFEGANTVSATEELPPADILPTQALFGGAVNGGIHTRTATAQIASIPQVAALNGSYLVAMDTRTGKRVWMDKHLTADVPSGGALATFGGGITTTDSGLVFTGNGAALSAFDSRTGAVVWTSPPLPATPWQPTVYSVNGKEYVAVQAGNNTGTFTQGAAPAGGAIGAVNGAAQTPKMYVYALP